MKLSHNIMWLAAAILATALAAGCDRNKPAQAAGLKLERPTQHAAEKLDQSAARINQNGAQAADKFDDAIITTKVKAALIGDSGVKALQIRVDTADGVVTLTGAVETARILEWATQVAQAVQGVKSVDNRLNVRTDA